MGGPPGVQAPTAGQACSAGCLPGANTENLSLVHGAVSSILTGCPNSSSKLNDSSGNVPRSHSRLTTYLERCVAAPRCQWR